MRRSGSFKLLALLLAFFLLAAACGDDDDDDTGGGGDDDTTEPSEEDVPEGGTLVLGAEQEPECADWISSCAGASWGYWTMNVHTMPRTYDAVKEGDTWVYTENDLLAEETEVGEDPQTLTYHINPDAVWSDGEPITSTDFKYTWDQIANGEDIYDKTGYQDIESVDDSDPQTAVVTFKKNFSGWKQLFGGGYGVYPSHLLEGKDRNALMKDGYDFSGGPWIIDWQKGTQVTLTPNENWWGDAPKLEQVTFRFITDTAAEFQAFQAGEVSGIYPQPQPDVVDQIEGGIEGAETEFTADTGNLEAIWINNSRPPFDDVNVRKAFAYAIDRGAVVERLFGPLGVEEESNSLLPPILSFYTDVDAWSDYQLDLGQVDELMTGAGWAKNGDGIWAKGGETTKIEIKSTTGNQRRELTEQILQQQLKAAGFELTINNQEAGDLFGDLLPKGDYQIALYAQVLTAIEPGLCALFCSANIPTAENEFSGQNWQRVNIPELDGPLQEVDENLDNDERATAQKEADGIMAENMISLPLDPLPNILLWKPEVVGPIGDNPILGPFYNINEWGVEQ